MPSIGPLEIFFVAVIALLIFGPERLPEMARKVGRATNELRRMVAEVRSEFDLAMDEDDTSRSTTRSSTSVDDEQESDLDLGEDEDAGWDEPGEQDDEDAWDELEDQGQPPIAEGLEDADRPAAAATDAPDQDTTEAGEAQGAEDDPQAATKDSGARGSPASSGGS